MAVPGRGPAPLYPPVTRRRRLVKVGTFSVDPAEVVAIELPYRVPASPTRSAYGVTVYLRSGAKLTAWWTLSDRVSAAATMAERDGAYAALKAAL